jgi:hypothetical protein
MDCEHLVVELETDYVPLSSERLTYAHRFVCAVCRLEAMIIEHVAYV